MSRPPFETLNLGRELGDEDSAVTENRRRFAAALGISGEALFEQRQVHGTRVRDVGREDRAAHVATLEGDGLILRSGGGAVAVRTADCVPILIAHPPTGHVAAVHAGWRGMVAGVIPEAIDALGHDPQTLVVAMGPHIRVGAFEIGEEVAREMERAAGRAEVVDRRGPKPHGSLAALGFHQLRDTGVPAEAIDDVGGCTHAEAAHFFSHRRDGGITGRHLSAIVAKGPP